MMETEYMLSTVDNPYNPFDQFNLWLMFDKEKGYDSCERLARFVHLKEEMTQKEIEEEIDRAMNELINLDFTNTFIKVTKETVIKPQQAT